MTFIWPAMLWFLLTIPLLVLLYIRLQRRRKQFAVHYGNFGLLQEATGQKPGLRRHIPAILFLIGITILVVALARPQTVLSLPRVEGTVILAFDISGSMAATDMTPTRMEAAKAVVRDFVTRQPSTVQIGIVAFSDSGISVQPPTNDKAAILASLNRLQPQRGTSLANGILVSLDTIAKLLGQAPEDSGDIAPQLLPTPTPVPEGTYSSAEIVLLTDGENNLNPDPLKAAQQAADRGVRIHTIGVGSLTGTNLEVNGFTVHTQLDEAMLQQISEMTGGNYYLAATQEDLRAIYNSIQPQIMIKQEKTEITSILAGISILILLTGSMFSLFWFGRVP
jgi:Ca-activated chloride channel homolog